MNLTSYTPSRNVYNFGTQLRKGKAAEKLLDTYFSRWYVIEVIPREIERHIHSDRLFIDPYDHQTIVEYKADYIGHATGNVYIETLSVDKTNTPGWVFTTQADVLVYWVVGTGQVLAFRPDDLRANVERWSQQYRLVGTRNENSKGGGILVPISELQKLSIFEGVLYDPLAPVHLARH